MPGSSSTIAPHSPGRSRRSLPSQIATTAASAAPARVSRHERALGRQRLVEDEQERGRRAPCSAVRRLGLGAPDADELPRLVEQASRRLRAGGERCRQRVRRPRRCAGATSASSTPRAAPARSLRQSRARVGSGGPQPGRRASGRATRPAPRRRRVRRPWPPRAARSPGPAASVEYHSPTASASRRSSSLPPRSSCRRSRARAGRRTPRRSSRKSGSPGRRSHSCESRRAGSAEQLDGGGRGLVRPPQLGAALGLELVACIGQERVVLARAALEPLAAAAPVLDVRRHGHHRRQARRRAASSGFP